MNNLEEAARESFAEELMKEDNKNISYVEAFKRGAKYIYNKLNSNTFKQIAEEVKLQYSETPQAAYESAIIAMNKLKDLL